MIAAATAAVAAVDVTVVAGVLLMALSVAVVAVLAEVETGAVGVLDTIAVPLTTGFNATMGKFCAAKRVLVAAPGAAADRNPNPETGSGFAVATTEGAEVLVTVVATADFDFLTPLLRGLGP